MDPGGRGVNGQFAVPGYGSPTQRFRFIAGGIGITPILPMLGLTERIGVDWSMVYAGRSRDSLPFVDEVARFGDRIQIRTDDVSGLPTAPELLGDCPDGTAVYACRPAPMLTAIRAQLGGRDNVELHFERFAAGPVIDGKEFRVSVASRPTPVSKGSAAPAARGCSTGPSTIATRCSPTPNAATA
jgi:ferredoxin-NADP reductase